MINVRYNQLTVVDWDLPSLKTISIKGILVAHRVFQVLTTMKPNRMEWYTSSVTHGTTTPDERLFQRESSGVSVLTVGSVIL
jgi:hypothetical protein